MATEQQAVDPATAPPEQLLGERARVEYASGAGFEGVICKLDDRDCGQRILHLNWQDSVVRSADPTKATVDVTLCDGGGDAP